MNSSTLILSITKIQIPKDLSIDFITQLINRGLTSIDYFGAEIDNQEDYLSDDMKLASYAVSYFHFNFDTEESINYDSLNSEDVNHLLFELIKKSANIEMRADEKDITIYL